MNFLNNLCLKPKTSKNTDIEKEILFPVQQIQDYNKKPLQIINLESQYLPINMPFNNSSKENAPMFNKCHFQNVNFYFK